MDLRRDTASSQQDMSRNSARHNPDHTSQHAYETSGPIWLCDPDLLSFTSTVQDPMFSAMTSGNMARLSRTDLDLPSVVLGGTNLPDPIYELNQHSLPGYNQVLTEPGSWYHGSEQRLIGHPQTRNTLCPESSLTDPYPRASYGFASFDSHYRQQHPELPHEQIMLSQYGPGVTTQFEQADRRVQSLLANSSVLQHQSSHETSQEPLANRDLQFPTTEPSRLSPKLDGFRRALYDADYPCDLTQYTPFGHFPSCSTSSACEFDNHNITNENMQSIDHYSELAHQKERLESGHRGQYLPAGPSYVQYQEHDQELGSSVEPYEDLELVRQDLYQESQDQPCPQCGQNVTGTCPDCAPNAKPRTKRKVPRVFMHSILADVPDYGAALREFFPPMDPLNIIGDDYEQCKLESERYIREFLDAINHDLATNPDLSLDHIEWRLRQQKSLTYKINDRRRETMEMYGDSKVAASLRLLFQEVMNLHEGVQRPVYPTTGEATRYGTSTNLVCSARLDSITKMLRNDKRIVQDVIEGKGIRALVKDPVSYEKRKLTNDACNRKKVLSKAAPLLVPDVQPESTNASINDGGLEMDIPNSTSVSEIQGRKRKRAKQG